MVAASRNEYLVKVLFTATCKREIDTGPSSLEYGYRQWQWSAEDCPQFAPEENWKGFLFLHGSGTAWHKPAFAQRCQPYVRHLVWIEWQRT